MYRIETPNKNYNGITWDIQFYNGVAEIGDIEKANVLANDFKYKKTEIVEEVVENNNSNNNNLEELTIKELKVIAEEKNVDVKGMKKDDILSALQELGE